jgi:hypothetical protein
MKQVHLWTPLAYFVFAFATVSAKDLPDASTGCHLVVPDDWTVARPQASGASVVQATKGDRTKSVLLYVGTVSGGASIQDGSPFIQGVEHGIVSSGGKIETRDHRKLGNSDFYVLTCSVANGVQSFMWVTIANGHMYEIGLYEATDPSKDAELMAVLKSFSIATP